MSAAESENLSKGMNTSSPGSPSSGGEMTDGGRAVGGADTSVQEEHNEQQQQQQTEQEGGEHQEHVQDYSLAGIGARVYNQYIRPREDDSPLRANTPINNATNANIPASQPENGGPIHLRDLPERPRASANIVAAVQAATAAATSGVQVAMTAAGVGTQSSTSIMKENEQPMKTEQSSPKMDATKDAEAADKEDEDASSAVEKTQQSQSSGSTATNAVTQGPLASEQNRPSNPDDSATLPQIPAWPNAPATIEPHEHTDKIIKQVEYYFCDDNLVQDAHLLGRTGSDGTGWVSINEILGFKKMREFKPKTRVKASLKLSKMLELHNTDKFIRRRWPLKHAPRVAARPDPKKERDAQLAEQPWLTKGMMEPTGFETENVNQGPLHLQEYQHERRHYDPEESFTARIDRAVCFFMARRKFHEKAAKIFGKYLAFGGFSGGQNMFTGGVDEKELDDYDKDDILLMKAQWGVSERVLEGVEPDEGEPSWTVDFEGMTKAFLSYEFMQHFDWTNEQVVFDTTNILRNFFNYLVIHDVCPEYKDDIDKAIAVTHLAEKEFPELAKVDQVMPGEFNMACSILFNGYYSQYMPVDLDADWVQEDDRDSAMNKKRAKAVFEVGTNAHCTDAQLDALDLVKGDTVQPNVSEHDIGLNVVSVENASGEAKDVYDADKFKGRFRRAGILHCTHWPLPQARPSDLPKHVVDAAKAKTADTYKFVMDEEALKHFSPGMKLEAIVKELDCGLVWLDIVQRVFPTFLKYTLNEQAKDWKEPGPPKDWMRRQEEQKPGADQEVVKREDEDETPD